MALRLLLSLMPEEEKFVANFAAHAVRWGLAANIVWAWVFTIPAAGCVGFLSYWLISLMF
ncbi:MAG: hypothetical protein H7Z12_01665 [Rhodospirillaceae bacterium]|nr:hypothetical protein [Rhodospirillales bacterium]